MNQNEQLEAKNSEIQVLKTAIERQTVDMKSLTVRHTTIQNELQMQVKNLAETNLDLEATLADKRMKIQEQIVAAEKLELMMNQERENALELQLEVEMMKMDPFNEDVPLQPMMYCCFNERLSECVGSDEKSDLESRILALEILVRSQEHEISTLEERCRYFLHFYTSSSRNELEEFKDMKVDMEARSREFERKEECWAKIKRSSQAQIMALEARYNTSRHICELLKVF